MRFIGLDLAWSPRNQSGAAVLEGSPHGATLRDVRTLHTNAEIVAYLTQQAAAEPTHIAIDAPLCVPNQTGRRPAEAELGRVFARYEAGAHPANRRLLGKNGGVRGEELVAALAAHGFVAVDHIGASPSANTRQVVEVYPHAAMIALFGLACTLKYKARSGRSRATRLDAWATYQHHMRALAQADPWLTGHTDLLRQEVAMLHGRTLKAYEDQVDALLCAYIALYGARWGKARCRTFGSLALGHIFTPVP